MELNKEQIQILRHTAKNRRYCGGSADMDALVAAGLMSDCGRVGWCPDNYYALTDAGRSVLHAYDDNKESWNWSEDTVARTH